MKMMKSNRFTGSRLARVGIECIDVSRSTMRRCACGQTWSPMLQPRGRLPRHWWRCPTGCNADMASIDRLGSKELGTQP
jgi:hypothetical protein